MAFQMKLLKIFAAFRNSLYNNNTRRFLPEIQQSCHLSKNADQNLSIEKPKKPLTPYFRYLVHIRPTLVEKNPNFKITEITKIASEEWQKMEPKLKQKFEQEYQKEMKDYNILKEQYQNNLTEDDILEIKREKFAKKAAKEKRQLKKKISTLDKPKKPISPFLTFLLEQKQNTKMKYSDLQVKASHEWASLPNEKKLYYNNKHKEEMETYKKQLQIWEKKMIDLGNFDVVRTKSLVSKNKK